MAAASMSTSLRRSIGRGPDRASRHEFFCHRAMTVQTFQLDAGRATPIRLFFAEWSVEPAVAQSHGRGHGPELIPSVALIDPGSLVSFQAAPLRLHSPRLLVERVNLLIKTGHLGFRFVGAAQLFKRLADRKFGRFSHSRRSQHPSVSYRVSNRDLWHISAVRCNAAVPPGSRLHNHCSVHLA